jgi:hypothetical protein
MSIIGAALAAEVDGLMHPDRALLGPGCLVVHGSDSRTLFCFKCYLLKSWSLITGPERVRTRSNGNRTCGHVDRSSSAAFRNDHDTHHPAPVSVAPSLRHEHIRSSNCILANVARQPSGVPASYNLHANHRVGARAPAHSAGYQKLNSIARINVTCRGSLLSDHDASRYSGQGKLQQYPSNTTRRLNWAKTCIQQTPK